MIVPRYADQLSYPGQGRGNGTSEIGRRATADTSDGVAGRSSVSGAAQCVEKQPTVQGRTRVAGLACREGECRVDQRDYSLAPLVPATKKKDVVGTMMNAVLIDFWWVLWQDAVWY
jgi:hypothetical protein